MTHFAVTNIGCISWKNGSDGQLVVAGGGKAETCILSEIRPYPLNLPRKIIARWNFNVRQIACTRHQSRVVLRKADEQRRVANGDGSTF
jgi:hypothetical protein